MMIADNIFSQEKIREKLIIYCISGALEGLGLVSITGYIEYVF